MTKDTFKDIIKDKVIRARVDSVTIEKLDYCTLELKISRSDVIRNGINKIYHEICQK